ncbi:MAG: metal ABC transporter substrate-binding protein [Oscillospiraceae bacterium]|nr:metal ABC transporter substrate-binding protein [Oscillospiraceae bacterium]
MKNYISLFLSAVLALVLLTGAAIPASAENASEPAEKLSIVTTIFPEYDWVMNILGDQAANADVTMLLDNGVDLHSYQPTVDDIVKISGCDLFVYVGGESDDWVEDALQEAVNDEMITLNLLEILGEKVKEEEVMEGMEAEHDHEEEHDHDEDHEEAHHHEEGEAEYDEHVWLSLRHASAICERIAEVLAALDPDHAEGYQANAAAYITKLSALDAEYQAAVNSAQVKTLLFGDRFPFRYLTDDYGLDYYAAFVGCSAETEASFETIVFLSGKLDELGLHAICQIESADGKIAETIRNNTKAQDQEILTLDSMQSTTSRDAAEGTSYLSVMEGNLEVLKAALQ